jgi:hypothetical protein
MGCATNFNPKYGECEDSSIRKAMIDLRLTGQSSEFFQCSYERSQIQNAEQLESEHQAKLKINPNYLEDERKKNLEIEEQKLIFQKRQAKAIEVGTKIDEFIICFGEPTTKEISNGNVVLWYDDQNKPMFFTFKKNRLISITIDRDTIKSRLENKKFEYQAAQSERQHQENLYQAEVARRQAAWHYFLDNRTRTTNCHRMYDGSVQCNTN